jgi:tRNA A37 threonylcarbamoyltransferase TsaD
MMNENAKKINNGAIKVMPNGSCLCPQCHKFFSVKNYTDEQMEALNKYGVCAHCTPAEESAEAETETIAEAVVETVVETVEAPEKKAVKKAIEKTVPAEKKVSAFKLVRDLVENANLSDEQIALLTDKTFTQKNAHIAYALLMPVDEKLSYKEQAVKYNKARYAKKAVELNGKAYYMTNDIYKKNVLSVKEMLASFVG